MFYIKGKIIKRSCTFKIDSDVTLIREGLLEFSKQRVSRNSSTLNILLVKEFQSNLKLESW